MTSMRERMARALDQTAFEIVEIFNGPDNTADVYRRVDAILAEMETPSEDVLTSMCYAWDNTPPDLGQIEAAGDGVKSMIRAIRDGK